MDFMDKYIYKEAGPCHIPAYFYLGRPDKNT